MWFPDVSFFAARAEYEVAFHVVQEFRCLFSLGESVLSLGRLACERRRIVASLRREKRHPEIRLLSQAIVRPPVVHLHHNLVVLHQK